MSMLQCIISYCYISRQHENVGKVQSHTQVSTYRKGGVEVLHGFGIPDCPEEVHVLMLDMLQVALHHDSSNRLKCCNCHGHMHITNHSKCCRVYGPMHVSDWSGGCNCQVIMC